ncbi:hypothetical protein AAG906_028930 [Vitis piasezkii]
MASSSNVPTMNLTHGEKPEKFNGNEFKRWQQKMLFYLTTLNLARFLHEECPILEEGETNKEKVAAVDAWKHSDFLCRNYVLNGLDNTLYNVYCSLKTAKELWDSLDKKYKTEDAGMKKFIVGKFLDFKMIDSKTVISQVQELQVILHEIHSEGMSLSDSFQVAAVIEKLPPLWKDFKNYLKHKRKEMNLEELIVRLRIEEDNRKSEKKGNNSMEAKANVIEQGPKTNKKRKHGDQNQNQGSNAAKKFKGKCYNCGKTGHKSNDCRKPKKEKKPQANVTEFDKLSNDVSEMNLSAVVSECNIVGNTKECSKVEGRGKVILKMTSGKELTLNDVLHVPDIRKNLVSGSLLSKNGFKLVFVSDKFVLTKNEMFVGKGYLSDGLFKMNVMTVVPKSINNNKIDSSAYLLESSNIWHVENQLSKKIKAIRSDRGGEYESPFEEFCLEHGIIHQTTAPYSPQSNGIAERKNRTLKEMMNATLLSSVYPIIYGRIFVKIGPKTIDCIFIGYANNSSAYRFLVYKSEIPDVHVNTIIESRNAAFFETIFPYNKSSETSTQKRTHDITFGNNQLEVNQESKEKQVDEEPRRGKRARKSTSFGPDFLTYLLENDPQTFKEAMSSPEASYWKEAINSEIESILQNHTWELVALPPGTKTLGCKWIFKKKMKADGSIDKYKARLVAKGYKQREGLDYFDTYSPVSRITSIRMLIAIAAINNLEIHQMDVKTTFLNGELDEEIYMDQPEGFIAPGQERKVCKLVKSLYGLKQAPKQWHEKFDNAMISNGFKINECDKCVYVKNTQKGYVIVCLYVDDMLIIGSDTNMIKMTKQMLSSRFDMKDLGVADIILGIKVSKTSDGLILSQSHYIEKILEKFKKYDIRPKKTPMDVNLHLFKNTGIGKSQLEYSRIIGSLMYVMNCTRPDIAYSVSKLSRFTSNPGENHWKSIIRVLGYLKYTQNYGLHFTRYPAVLEGYNDANWISDSKDSKSTSGYVFTLGGAADIPNWSKPVPAICIHCDSQSAIGRAQSHNYNGKSRHIRRRHNTVRQLLSNGIISIDYVRSKDNIADPLTKGLTREQVESSSKGMGLKPMK